VNLKPVIKRLRDECPALRLVGGAAEFERALQGLTTMPAAFVLPAADAGERSPFGNQIVEQRVHSEFAIIFATRNLADNEGAAAMETLEPVRVSVRDALLSWQPDDDSDGCEFSSGRMLQFDPNNVLWWQDSYITAFTIRSQ
jgi:hypothetical protein